MEIWHEAQEEGIRNESASVRDVYSQINILKLYALSLFDGILK